MEATPYGIEIPLQVFWRPPRNLEPRLPLLPVGPEAGDLGHLKAGKVRFHDYLHADFKASVTFDLYGIQ